MGRAERVTKVLKSYDPKLYCEKQGDGKLCVFRESQRIESYEVNGQAVHFVRPQPYFVFALTTDWKMKSPPVDWGLIPILNRIKAIDLWNGRDLAQECIDQVHKNTEIAEKDARNSTEAFLSEFRGQFAKTFNGVNTSTMDKIDKRRLGERNGNC